MNREQPKGDIDKSLKTDSAKKVIEYLRYEMQLMRINQSDYQKDYEYEKRGFLIPFGGIMEFYMSEKRRIENLDDETKREQDQQKLDDRLTENVKRFNPTPGIVLESEDVDVLMNLVYEGLVSMNLDTESSAEPTEKRSSLRTAPEFMLQIIELLKGKVNEVEEPDKVREIDKYISYLRWMVNAEMDFTKSLLSYYYGPERQEEGLANNVCYIRERLKFCYSMSRDGKSSESSWLTNRQRAISGDFNKITAGCCSIEIRDELAMQETPEHVRLAVLFNELAILKGYRNLVDYRRNIQNETGILDDSSLTFDKNQRIQEIQSQINDILKGNVK